MWGPVFCIDFGAGYTKVAVRTDAESDAVLLAPDVLQGGDDAFCVPSVVAGWHAKDGKAEFACGHKAAGLTGGNGIDVKHNWKRELFELSATQPAGLAAMLEAPELVDLAGRFQVPLTQLQHLKQLVASAHALTGSQVPVGESLKVRKLRGMAEVFFAFVRKYTLEACAARTPAVPNADKIPAVLAVPAFATEEELKNLPGVQILLQAMAKTGWPLLPSRPVVSEPLANMVGVLTNGANALLRLPAHKGHKASVDIDVGKMFSKGPLMTAISNGAHYPLYRALVVDIGAYTTDVGLIEVPTHEPNGGSVREWHIRQKSVPLGVMELDRRVVAALPSAQAAFLSSGSMTAINWEDFRSQVYSQRKAFRTLEMTIPARGDKAVVEGVIQGFADEIAKHVTSFCEGLQPASMQEVIITGGGSRIAAVKEAIETSAALPGKPVVKVHSARRVTAIVDAIARQLGKAVRGGTAMGGVSTFLSRTSDELSRAESVK